jgi:uncharacterized protein (DUF1330 family)
MTITDPEAYLRCRSAFFPTFERSEMSSTRRRRRHRAGGELAAGRTVILRFADRETALEWYHSDDHQRISEHRRQGVTQHVAVVMDERPAVDRSTSRSGLVGLGATRHGGSSRRRAGARPGSSTDARAWRGNGGLDARTRRLADHCPRRRARGRRWPATPHGW